LFLANEIPTSSKDPYALRRCALGIIRIICEFSLDLNIKDKIKYSASLYDLKYDDNLLVQILDFIYERFRHWLKLSSKDGFVSAALYKKSGSLCQEYKVLRFLENILYENKDLFFTFKRVVNVVKSSQVESSAIDKQLLTAIEEKLLKQIEVLDSAIRDFYSAKESDLVSIFKDIEETVSILFKDTMIMDKNLEIQKHRIAVLNLLYSSFIKIADFSLIDL
jgi:glycyl-tRNA synthetase beta chain